MEKFVSILLYILMNKYSHIMEITVIIENDTKPENANLDTHSGLALYIITDKGKKILFDTGASTTALINNAKKLGIDLKEIELCIISHAHFDHAGGLSSFLDINQRAKVYFLKAAHQSDSFFKKAFLKKFIGIPKIIFQKYLERIEFIDEFTQINDEIEIISEIEISHPLAKGNFSMFQKRDGKFFPDKFKHELICTIKSTNGLIVITGCSHSGILNMLETTAKQYPDTKIHAVLGGFHLMTIPFLKNSMAGSEADITEIAKGLQTFNIPHIYSMHCTGRKPYGVMKRVLKNSLEFLNAGDKIILN
jgi:7,8-dihydropterin-6-yl-methyl-4-(beta-D-ribofuranosyl)aminobenzene 5'-phosphate synthase